MVTPFGADGRLDLPAWSRLIERQIAGGTAALVVAGSTGEAAMLDEAEYRQLLGATVSTVAGRVPVIAGTGQSGTAKTVMQTRAAAALGADMALVVTPPYVRPSQEGLVAHYQQVADEGGLPVLLYNVPTRTGVDLLPETTARLVSHPAIAGIKEAVADAGRMASLVALKSGTFSVLSGDDGSACRSQLAGADGCISVASNVAPRAFFKLCELSRAGEAEQARTLDQRLGALFDFLGIEPNPIPAKAVLAALSLCQDGLRLPLTTLSIAHQARLSAIIALIEDLEG